MTLTYSLMAELIPESELDVVPDGEKIVVDGNDEEDNGSGETTSND